MEGKPVSAPIDPDLLFYKDKRMAVATFNIIKEKINGKIRVGICADDSKQKRYLKEGEIISSPTVFLEGLFCTLIVHAHEIRNLATFDAPGAYLHADIPKDKIISMKIRGDFVDIMCQVNP